MKRKRTRQNITPKRTRQDVFDITFFMKGGFGQIGSKIFECLDDYTFVNCKLVCKSWLQFIDNRRSSWLREIFVLKDHILCQGGHLIDTIENFYTEGGLEVHELQPRNYYRHKRRFLQILDELIVKSKTIQEVKNITVFLRKIVNQWVDVEFGYEFTMGRISHWTWDDIFEIFVRHGIGELSVLIHDSQMCLNQGFLQDLLNLQFEASRNDQGIHHFKLLWTLLKGMHTDKLSEIIEQSIYKVFSLSSLEYFQNAAKLRANFGDGLTDLDYFKTLYNLSGGVPKDFLFGSTYDQLNFEIVQYVLDHIVEGPLSQSNLSQSNYLVEEGTLLHYWVDKDFEIFELIASRWDGELNPRNKDGITPLHIACRTRGHEEAIEFLFKHIESNSMPQDIHGNTPLHEAAKYGVYDNFKMVFTKFTEKNTRNHKGETPLQIACTNGKGIDDCPSTRAEKHQIVQYIVRRLKTDFNPADLKGNTPLHEAAKWGKFESFKMIASKCSEVNPANHQGMTPMHNACMLTSIGKPNRMKPEVFIGLEKIQKGKQDIIDYILKRAKNGMNPKDSKGNTPLHLLSRYGKYRSFVKVASRCADKNPRSQNGTTPLHEALTNKYDLDLFGGINPGKIVFGSFGFEVDLEEMEKGRQEIVKYIATYIKDDWNLADKDGNTPLHEAAKDGDYESFIRIAAKCTCKNPKNNVGKTPLHLVTNLLCTAEEGKVGNPAIFNYILNKEEHENDLILQDANGNTPVHMAFFSTHEFITQPEPSLPKYFVDMLQRIAEKNRLYASTLRNKEGHTPMDVVYGRYKTFVRNLFRRKSKSKPRIKKKRT